jgi:hypothetical protein
MLRVVVFVTATPERGAMLHDLLSWVSPMTGTELFGHSADGQNWPVIQTGSTCVASANNRAPDNSRKRPRI